MIPDFPTEKREILAFWNEYLVKKVNNLNGLVSNIPNYRNHEGDKWSHNSLGNYEKTHTYSEVSGVFQVGKREIPDLTSEGIKIKLEKVAEEISDQMSNNIFTRLEEAAKTVGNVVDGKDKPLTKELFLQAFEKIFIEFDENGNPILPTLVIHPRQWEVRKEDISPWESDKGFVEKWNEVIAVEKSAGIVRAADQRFTTTGKGIFARSNRAKTWFDRSDHSITYPCFEKEIWYR